MMGKVLIIVGVLLILAGLFITYGGHSWLGKLPGDFNIERKNFRLYFPLATSVLLSVIISILLYLYQKFSR